YRLAAKRNLTDDFYNRLNYEQYGGTPILGINAPVLLGHGISSPLAVKNMVLLSREVCNAKLPQKIKRSFRQFTSVGN
ncbi:MAG: phosphate--acyl-ACP acyltransferase, partial [Bacteroidetes bacterium]|nr:phosphate--acyl-ACP acyltransferase [Bacteroidota bacterium]